MRVRTPCERYDELIHFARKRELTDSEGLECIKHEENCPTGEHTLAGLERELGLPEGAFENGCPERGIPPAAEQREAVIRKLREMGHFQ
jgi:hypothetical protein